MVVSTAITQGILERKRLRILCLHGYEQDAGIFKTKLKHHINQLGDIVEFVFVTAPNTMYPYDIDGMDNMARSNAAKTGNSLGKSFYGWYGLKSAQPEVVYGLDKSMDYLMSELALQGPFDGIIGFSQGGAMAAVLCSLLEKQAKPVKFAIIASGYKLVDSRWTHIYDKPLNTPSLHMYGVLDSIIGISMSTELAAAFDDPSNYCFVGAHYVPKTAEAIGVMREFMTKFL